MNDEMWQHLWRMLVPTAEWHPDWGIEKYWMEHHDELGVPTDEKEHPTQHFRLFSKGKYVRWTPGGPQVLP